MAGGNISVSFKGSHSKTTRSQKFFGDIRKTLEKFLDRNRWTIAISLSMGLIFFAVSIGYCISYQNKVDREMVQTLKDQWQRGYEAGELAATEKYEELRKELEHVAIKEDQIVTDSKDIARVLYGLKDYMLSDNAKTAVIEVILSRVDCSFGEFGDTIYQVCRKDGQWIGYSGGDSDYLQADYDLVYSVLSATDRARITPRGCYFLRCSKGVVFVRQEWDSKNEWEVK